MNVPVKHTPSPSLLMDMERFEHLNRVGRVLANSALFPEHLRKGSQDQAIANGILVMNMAQRLGEDPLTVAQNIYFVGGKPGWSASYMIGKANQHGVFKNPISWEVSGTGDDLSVTAFGILVDTGQRVEATCSMAMAKAENWVKNAKYKSMPEQMLRYRSATFLIRLYCPEVMIGVPSTIEIEMGMKDVTPADQADIAAGSGSVAADAEIEDAIVEDDTPAKEEKPTPKPEPEKVKEPETSADPKLKTAETDGGANADSAAEDPEVVERMQAQFEMIKNDLTDAGADNLSQVEQFYEQTLDEMRTKTPSVYQQYMAFKAEL